MNEQNIRKINELANNTTLINYVNKIIEHINNSNYEQIDEILISNLYTAYENTNDSLKSELRDIITRVSNAFLLEEELDNLMLNRVYDDLEEMIKIINKSSKSYQQNHGEKLRERIKQINLRKKLEEEFLGIEERYLEDAIYLSQHLNRYGERVYSDEWLLDKLNSLHGRYEIVELANLIKNHGKEETMDYEEPTNDDIPTDEEPTNDDIPTDEEPTNDDIPTDEEPTNDDIPTDEEPTNDDIPTDEEPTNDDIPTDEEPTNDDIPTDEEPTNDDIPTDEEPTNDDIPTDEEPTEDKDLTKEGWIKKLIENLDIELDEEDLKLLLNQIKEIFMDIVNKDNKIFLEEMNSAKDFREKINIVTKYENKFIKYKELLSHKNPIIQAILDKQGLYNDFIHNYNIEKSNSTEYCWKEHEAVKTSIEYVDSTVQMMLYKLRLEDMLNVVKEPTEINHNKWKEDINEFVKLNRYDKNKISIYSTAFLKDKHKNLSVDEEFNIIGLNLEKTQTSKRRRVTGVKRITNWIGEHKLVTLAIGLAILGVTLLAIPQTHMMINSFLWHAGKKLGFGASSLAKLNATNIALSKSVAGGSYLYNSATGMYTLGGLASADAMYTAGSATLVGALEGILLGGSVGIFATKIIKSIANKIKEKRDKKLKKQSKNEKDDKLETYNKNEAKKHFENPGDLEPNEKTPQENNEQEEYQNTIDEIVNTDLFADREKEIEEEIQRRR